MPTVVFTPLAEASALVAALPRPIVHIKGYGSGMLLEGAPEPPAGSYSFDLPAERAEVERAAADAIAAVTRELGARTIAWDGDLYGADSFTALVPRLAQLDPSLTLCAFLHEFKRDKFRASWAAAPMALDVAAYVLPDPADPEGDAKYVQLGVDALRATGASGAVCLGGGGVVALEVAEERKLTPPVEFTFFPARRWRERMGSAYMDSSTVHTR